MTAAFHFACQLSVAAELLYRDRKPFLSSRFKTDKIKYAHPTFKHPLKLSIRCSSTSPPKPIQQDSPNLKPFKLHGSIAKTAALCALFSLSFGLLASEISPLSLKLAPILPNPNTLFFPALSAAVVHSSTAAPIAVTAAGLACFGIYSCALLIRVFPSLLAQMLELLGRYRFTFQFSHIGQQRIRFQVMMGEGQLKVNLEGCIGGEELVFEFEVLWEERELKVKLVGGIGGEKLVLETGLIKCVGRTLFT